MSLLEELSALGTDISDGLGRLMNNENVYIKLLKKLPASVEELEVLPYLDSGDIKSAIRSTHTIKGITGNLSITPLYKAYTQIVDLLRAEKIDEARALYEQTIPVQTEIFQVINKY